MPQLRRPFIGQGTRGPARSTSAVAGALMNWRLARQLAFQNKSPSAAVSAAKGKARLYGLLIDK